MKYNHRKIEKKWQKIWLENKTYKAKDASSKDKLYILDMFPYPSGAGLHVGHPEGYTATDIMSRYKRRKGYEVLHPMGWDAFGLPAENYAVKTGIKPQKSVKKNINTFRRQIQSLGLSYDWDRELNTSDESYYKWTQKLFLILYKNNLAYRKEAPVNWCSSCKTVLANEQVASDRCERCNSLVEHKNMEQWFFRITDFAEDLLKDLDDIDWPESIKTMQRNWIGKSEGALIDFSVKNSFEKIKIFTTRPDTIFGATFMVLAPENPIVDRITSPEFKKQVEEYKKQSLTLTELERTSLVKEKTGCFTGALAVNPASGEAMPVWISNYVVISYGTGAIMAVPAHDKRDYEFAKKFDLEIKQVVAPVDGLKELPYEESGISINSGNFDNLETEEMKKKIISYLQEKGVGKKQINYKLRDWLVSRQRYWGAPIPVIYCEKCGIVPVPEEDLPVKLPTDVDFNPTGDSPLKLSKSFHNVRCPICNEKARRESDTMDTFVDSSWYFLRYADINNSKEMFDKKKVAEWLPVDLYVGGAEHAVLHLLYSRFMTKVLRQFGYVDFKEPFSILKNQGLILGENGEKMSKSKGNVVNPDDIVKEFGADSMRLFEMFMGPLEDVKPWSTNSIKGVYRFLNKVWDEGMELKDVKGKRGKIKNESELEDLKKHQMKAIEKVSSDIESYNFNTAISSMMEYLNFLRTFHGKNTVEFKEAFKVLLSLLNPFAPHITSELWEIISFGKNADKDPWPEYDKKWLKEEKAVVAIQINGKFRGRIEMLIGRSQDEALKMALERESIKRRIGESRIKKTIWIQDKIINIIL